MFVVVCKRNSVVLMAQKGDHNASNEELRQPLFLPHLHEDPLDLEEGEGVFRGNSTALFEA